MRSAPLLLALLVPLAACGSGTDSLSSETDELSSFSNAPRDDVPEVDALGYAIELRAAVEDKGHESFDATVTGTFVTTESIDGLSLDFEGNEISRITVDGKDAKYTRKDSKLAIETGGRAKGETIRVRVDYRGSFYQADGANPNDFAGYGGAMARQSNRAGRPIYSTLAWPYKARRWLPLRDHPSDGAMVTMKLTFPNAFTVIANGDKKSAKENNDGTRTWEYAANESMPVYDFHFAAYDDWAEEHATANASGVRVNSFAYSGDKAIAGEITKELPKALDFYSETFGKYRFGSEVNFLEVPIFGGGMEHATVVSLDESLFDSKSSRAVAFHELAHHWSGNLVRIRTWNDFWMSEGFTDYLTNRFIEENDGTEAARSVWASARQSAFGDDKAHALRPAGNDVDVLTIFDDVSYKKGAFVLRMLEKKFGRETFSAFLKSWFTKRAFSSVTTNDFEAALAESTKSDVSRFFNGFVYESGRPTLKASWKRLDADAIELSIDQTQSGGPASGYDILLDADVQVGDTTTRVTVPLDSRHVTARVALTGDPSKITLDPDVFAYATMAP